VVWKFPHSRREKKPAAEEVHVKKPVIKVSRRYCGKVEKKDN